MFEPTERPRVFALPPGADFAGSVVRGLVARSAGLPPEALARATIYANSGRMQRALRTAFDGHGARLLPRLRLLTDLGADTPLAELPPPVPALRRKLELAHLVGRLLDAEPGLAPRASIHDLADSLARLLDEMQDERVSAETLRSLDVGGQSAHWERSLRFIDIVARYAEETHGAPDAASRQSAAVEALTRAWAAAPPRDPVLIVGSTGSRGATLRLMEAVARLPQGALILPGFDADQPDHVWERLDDALTGEDHPQFRYARIMDRLGLSPAGIAPWDDAPAPDPSRNRLVSLALRPAPVTDQWMREGAGLGDLRAATDAVSLVEAASPRMEATAIALRLRQAAEDGRRAALVTPDRNLTRRVTALLDRWGIEPDDSAGRPLALSAPGRLLRHVADLSGRPLTPDALLTVLKHPLVRAGQPRGRHLLFVRELELHLRRDGPAFPEAATLVAWAKDDPQRQAWAGALACLFVLPAHGTAPLSDHVAAHLRVAEALCAGPEGSELWEEEAGRAARAAMDDLAREAPHGGEMGARDYATLLAGLLGAEEVRSAVRPHPGIMIWGTLEARVGGADLVVLGGLNEGIWPATPTPDPWLNRKMRHEAGLLLPERQVGLSAHDFQQAVGAAEVVLTRATRDTEAETVPARWLNRLTNLMAGLPAQGGDAALAAMRRRGDVWLAHAARLDAAHAALPATRPSPRPPAAQRPAQLSVTDITRLIRDPYAIYARKVLRLKKLDPLVRAPDAPLRGTVIHDIFERAIREAGDALDAATLCEIARQELDAQVPWPAARALWRARIERLAGWFAATEADRRASATPMLLEGSGALRFDDLGFTLTGKADRVDRLAGGGYAIYDYKTGSPPSARQVRAFDKQLLLEAMMAEAGAFPGLPAEPVRRLAYIGLGSKPSADPLPLDEGDEPINVARTAAEFRRLIAAYLDAGRGFTARRAMAESRFAGDYDHLARFGEWDDSTDASPTEVR